MQSGGRFGLPAAFVFIIMGCARLAGGEREHMPVMAFCKKCKQEVAPDSVCSLCGQKLPAGSLRLSWTYEHAPVRDFLSWNSILRVALPVLALLVLLVIGVEWARKGLLGVQLLMAQGFWGLLLMLAAAMIMAAFLALLMRGREQVCYVLDQKGIHVQVWQVKPPFLKRLLHMVPEDAETGPRGYAVWMLEEKHIPWLVIRRVGFWPDRDKILLYSPRFWLALPLHALPDTYDDAVRFIYDHVKKRPGVMQPPPAKEEKITAKV